MRRNKTIKQNYKRILVGQLTSGILHEINNLLSGILGFSQLLVNELPKNSQWCKDAEKIEKSAQNCRRIVKNLLVFSRDKDFEFGQENINEIIDRSLDLLAYNLNSKNIKIKKHFEENIPLINASFIHLQQVFVNLINSFIEIGSKNHEIKISTFKDNKNVKVIFENLGREIKENPSFLLNYEIIQKHNGKIYKENNGLSYIIELPYH